MDWIFGNNEKPTETQLIMGMLAEQGKQIHAMIEELKLLQVLVSKCLKEEEKKEEKEVEVQVPLPYYGDLDKFLNGCIIDDESE